MKINATTASHMVQRNLKVKLLNFFKHRDDGFRFRRPKTRQHERMIPFAIFKRITTDLLKHKPLPDISVFKGSVGLYLEVVLQETG